MGLNRIARGGREVLVLIIIALFRDCTVKPAHEVTSIKQSLVLRGHLFLILSYKYSYELNLF